MLPAVFLFALLLMRPQKKENTHLEDKITNCEAQEEEKSFDIMEALKISIRIAQQKGRPEQIYQPSGLEFDCTVEVPPDDSLPTPHRHRLKAKVIAGNEDHFISAPANVFAWIESKKILARRSVAAGGDNT